MPANRDALPHRLMRELAPAVQAGEWYSHRPDFYYRMLAAHCGRLDIWETEYQHVLDGAAAIVEWYKGSGLRPFLDAMPDQEERQKFLAEYATRIRDAYPEEPNGTVFFPFKRIFVVAYAA
jgi:trans-aconitate 2-methyltransferase